MAIQKAFPEQWKNDSSEYILTKTTGFIGFMNFFSDILKREGVNKYGTEYFLKLFEKVKVDFAEFTNENYSSGAIGQNKIRDILRKSLIE